MEKSMLDYALEYLDMGYSIIPLNPSPDKKYGKKPVIPHWKDYQERFPTKTEIREWWSKRPDAMIGVVCGKLSNIIALDADSEEAKIKLDNDLPESFITPIVETPRPGWHYWFKYHPGITNSNNGLIHTRGHGGYITAPPSKRSDGKAYSWLVPLAGNPILEIPSIILNKYLSVYKGKNKEIIDDSHKESSSVILRHLTFDEPGRNETLFHIALSLLRGGMQQENVYYVIENIAKSICKPEMEESEIKTSIRSAIERNSRTRIPIKQAIENFISVIDGHFSVTEVYKESFIVTPEDKHAVRQALLTLKKQGVIEKVGDKNGIYRKVEDSISFVDISTVEDLEFIDLRWPMQIEKLVQVSPKSIVIIAGDTEAGKSAFLSSFASLNLDKHKILYFSSEMTPQRFKNRISNIKDQRPLSQWSKLLFTMDKTKDFHDSIDPDAINIIDYLELEPDATFNAAKYLRNIFEKLNKGIAIVALQKKKGEVMAYGRDWTMQKCEFYLTLSTTEEGNIAKIEKAKNWTREFCNPVGYKNKFLLVKGIKFFPDKLRPDWYKGEGNKEEDF